MPTAFLLSIIFFKEHGSGSFFALPYPIKPPHKFIVLKTKRGLCFIPNLLFPLFHSKTRLPVKLGKKDHFGLIKQVKRPLP